TGAARRLAQRGRLADIDGETKTARAELESRRQAVMAARSDIVAAAAAEADARLKWRDKQREADAARELVAAAEREVGRSAARISGRNEAKAGGGAGGAEARPEKSEAERALAPPPAATKLEEKLAAVRRDIDTKRTQLAETRAEAQALAREIELAERRTVA